MKKRIMNVLNYLISKYKNQKMIQFQFRGFVKVKNIKKKFKLRQQKINNQKQNVEFDQTNQIRKFNTILKKQRSYLIEKNNQFEKYQKNQINESFKFQYEISILMLGVGINLQKEQQLRTQMYPNLTFSPDYKHEKMNLSENGKLAEISGAEYGYCICEQVIPKIGITRFAFEILRIDGWCEVGIGFRDMIKDNEYQLKVKVKGKNMTNFNRSYLLQDSSVTYFHDSNNTQGQKFQFVSNDIIIIEVSVEVKYIKWSKQNSQDSLITQIDTSYDLYPCVYLDDSKVRIKKIS